MNNKKRSISKKKRENQVEINLFLKVLLMIK